MPLKKYLVRLKHIITQKTIQVPNKIAVLGEEAAKGHDISVYYLFLAAQCKV